MHNNDDPQDLSSDNTPSQMNGDVSDSTPSQMNGNASDSTPSQMNGNTSDSTPNQINGDVSDSTPSKIRGEETKQDDEHSENSQIPDSGLISDSGLIANSGLIEETAPIAEQPKADYQLLYTTAYHQIYSIVGEGRRYTSKPSSLRQAICAGKRACSSANIPCCRSWNAPISCVYGSCATTRK